MTLAALPHLALAQPPAPQPPAQQPATQQQPAHQQPAQQPATQQQPARQPATPQQPAQQSAAAPTAPPRQPSSPAPAAAPPEPAAAASDSATDGPTQPAAEITTTVAPVAVVPLVGEGVPTTVAGPAVTTIVAQLRGTVQARPVRVLGDAARLAAMAACTDEPCMGAQVAELGAVAGVIIRIAAARPVGSWLVQIELRDPVSGALRKQLERSLPAGDEAAISATLAGTADEFATHLPAPPAASTLLLAINVDGSNITVDGEAAGESPVGPIEVAPGRHTVSVAQHGYSTMSQVVDVGEGEAARLNIDLSPDVLALEREEEARTAQQPWYENHWVWAGGGAALVVITVGVILLASGGDEAGRRGIPVPPIH